MNVDVETAIDIQRSRLEVAAFASDPNNATIWYKNIKTVEWVTEKPLAVGSRFSFVAHFLGRRLAYTYQVREFELGERFVMSTTEGPFPMETIYRWADAPDGGTHMTLINRGEPSGFSKLAAPLMSVAMRRANNKDLKKLKKILEAQ
ncbi:SRPBCC family protein [Arthrobacter monumenti]